MAVPLPNLLDGILLCDVGNFLEGIFFLVFEKVLDGILAMNHTWDRDKEKGRRLQSGGPVSHTETQWEGIMWEGRYSTLGIGCVSQLAYFASTNGKMSTMCCMSLEPLSRPSVTAKLLNMATFPNDDPCTPATDVF